MKSALEITTIIANGLAETAASIPEYSDYNIVISTERIFLDDYAPKVEDYITRINAHDIEEQGYETPLEMPYQHTIFFVVKIGQGQVNFAVWNTPITIQCLSEENDFKAAEAIMKKYIQNVNFEYLNGIIQSYFVPEVTDALSEVYAGFRALMTAKGYLRVPEDGVIFVQDIYVYPNWEDGDAANTPFKLPFISMTFDHSANPDPQAFSGQYGSTMALNRTNTQSFSVNCYLFTYEEDNETKKLLTDFSSRIIKAMNDMNAKFHIAARTNIKDENGIGGYLPLFDFWYVLTPLKVPGGEQLIDGGKAYYLYNLPDEYKVEGLKVKFTGVAYKFYEDKNGDGVSVYYGGIKYLDILVNQIEIVE